MPIASSLRLPDRLAIMLPIAVIVFSIVLVKSERIAIDATLAIGITYDLTIVGPLLYLAAIWRKSIPKATVLPFFIIGLITALQILPNDHLTHARLLQHYMLPLLELIVICVIGYKVHKGIQVFRLLSTAKQIDVFDLLVQVTNRFIRQQRIARILATEIAMVYFAFFSWKKSSQTNQEFTAYKENGSTALLGVLILLVMVETVVLHIVLLPWQPVIAWLLFGVSLYTALQLFAHGRAMRKRFSVVSAEGIYLKYGLAADVFIPHRLIASAVQTTSDIDNNEGRVQKVALLGALEPHNLVFSLTESVTIIGLYGIKKRGRIIACHIDEPAAFLRQINAAQAGYSSSSDSKG